MLEGKSIVKNVGVSVWRSSMCLDGGGSSNGAGGEGSNSCSGVGLHLDGVGRFKANDGKMNIYCLWLYMNLLTGGGLNGTVFRGSLER